MEFGFFSAENSLLQMDDNVATLLVFLQQVIRY